MLGLRELPKQPPEEPVASHPIVKPTREAPKWCSNEARTPALTNQLVTKTRWGQQTCGLNW